MFTFLYIIGILTVRFTFLINDVCAKKEIEFDAAAGENQKIINVSNNSLNVISVYNVHHTTTALLFEVHTHVYNVTLSKTEGPCLHCSVTGRNIGMVYRLRIWESEARMWLLNAGPKNLSVLIVIVGLDSYGPVPGGCNMEFSTEIAPYLRLKNSAGKNYLEFQHANIGFHRNVPEPACSLSLSLISYDVYVSYLKENEFGQNEYFDKIKSMSNISVIRTSSRKVLTHSEHPDTRISFLMYPNIGVVYNVIAKYTISGITKEALYVPISSYGCGNSEFTQYGCNFSFAMEGKLFLFLLSMYGFITTFFGHLFFGSTMYFFGFLAAFFVSIILLGRFSSFSTEKILEFSGMIGILGGGIYLALWFWLQSSVISLLLVGFEFGFLLAATVLYSPVGNLEINMNDRNYWLLLVMGSLFVTSLFLTYPTVLSILGSSVVGSFVMLLFYDDFIGSRLAYIILNIVKRAVSENLEFATNDLPFQLKDAMIFISWIGLSVSAVIIQSRSLSSTSSDINACCCKSKGPTSNINNSADCDARQPLISNSDSAFYNTFPK